MEEVGEVFDFGDAVLVEESLGFFVCFLFLVGN